MKKVRFLTKMVALLNQIKKILITAPGYNRLQDELRFLKTIERYKVIQAIAEARKHGDLSENAEYHAARDRQAFVEGRILELEDKISRAEVIDVSKLSGDRVRFGATVTLFDEDAEEEITYQVVGEDEANIKEGLLSVSSPLAASLIGREKGEVFEVSTPRGGKSYEIVSIVFK